jgi:hypothetical protein
MEIKKPQLVGLFWHSANLHLETDKPRPLGSLPIVRQQKAPAGRLGSWLFITELLLNYYRITTDFSQTFHRLFTGQIIPRNFAG